MSAEEKSGLQVKEIDDTNNVWDMIWKPPGVSGKFTLHKLLTE